MISKVINARVLIVVLIIGAIVIFTTELMHPERWSWLTQNTISENAPNVKPLEQRVYYPGLDADALKTVLDNSYWVAGDLKAWQNIVAILKDVPQSQLNKYSFGHVPYVQLKSDPKTFRGVIVNIKGNARQCIPIKQNSKDVDIEYIYQIALSPDSSPSEPIIINALSIPPGFPTGENIEPQRIDCTGFFFKRWAYPSQKDVMTAPLIMAKGFTWQEPIQSAQGQGEPSGWIIAVITIIASIIFYILIELRIKASLPPKPRKIPVEEFVFTPPTENDNSESKDNKE